MKEENNYPRCIFEPLLSFSPPPQAPHNTYITLHAHITEGLGRYQLLQASHDTKLSEGNTDANPASEQPANS